MINENIKRRRKELGFTLIEIAEKIGVSEATMQRYESGLIKNIPYNKLELLSSALRCSPSFLMGWTDEIDRSVKNLVPLQKVRFVPLLGKIACGEPILAEENFEGKIVLPDNVNADFALTCRGDSMVDARINDGDIVYIRQQPTVENGEIAAVLIGDEATLKRFYRQGDTVILKPENSAMTPLVYTASQLNEIQILGKAVYFLSKVK